jgi:hypothetical protein
MNSNPLQNPFATTSKTPPLGLGKVVGAKPPSFRRGFATPTTTLKTGSKNYHIPPRRIIRKKGGER